jgi:hypothetical protein
MQSRITVCLSLPLQDFQLLCHLKRFSAECFILFDKNAEEAYLQGVEVKM